MGKSPAFQLYAAEFLVDENVILMNNQEVGCYIKLMCFCWREKTIPTDVKKIARLCGETDEDMKKLWQSIKPCFKTTSNGRMVHPRLEIERKKQEEWRGKSSYGGVRSANLKKARKKGTHTDAQWKKLLKKANGVCPRCGEKMERFDKDHVIPIYQGGSDGIENLQPLCARCNSQKGPENVDYFKKQRDSTFKGG